MTTAVRLVFLAALANLVWPAARANAEAPVSIDVLAWNVFLRPTSLFQDRQEERAARIPDFVRDFEVVVLSEVFDDTMRDAIVSSLGATHPHASDVLGEDRGIKQDGGVVVLSRWPIESQEQLPFDKVCRGADCYADKGVLYVRIVKDGARFHLFATHLQAGAGMAERGVRRQQLHMIRRFIADKAIPQTEPVFIAGDLNVDRYTSEFKEMLAILDAGFPAQAGHRYTSDPRNALVPEHYPPKFIDYVLYSNAHRRPSRARLETRIFQTPPQKGADLSDHYGVLGLFRFEGLGDDAQ